MLDAIKCKLGFALEYNFFGNAGFTPAYFSHFENSMFDPLNGKAFC
jgi:hypothetical protein